MAQNLQVGQNSQTLVIKSTTPEDEMTISLKLKKNIYNIVHKSAMSLIMDGRRNQTITQILYKFKDQTFGVSSKA